MKHEELNKLNDLQSKIIIIEKELKYINAIGQNELNVSICGTYIHPRHIPHLTDDLLHILRERYENELHKLQKQFNEIILCSQVKSKGPDYIPINIV